MDERTLESVFDEFFTTKAHGTGLGLAFVKRVMIEHGGDVGRDESSRRWDARRHALAPRPKGRREGSGLGRGRRCRRRHRSRRPAGARRPLGRTRLQCSGRVGAHRPGERRRRSLRRSHARHGWDAAARTIARVAPRRARGHAHRARIGTPRGRRDAHGRERLPHEALRARRSSACDREGDGARRSRPSPSSSRRWTPSSRGEPGHGRAARAHRASGTDRRHGPDPRRDRDRQGAGCARDPSREANARTNPWWS